MDELRQDGVEVAIQGLPLHVPPHLDAGPQVDVADAETGAGRLADRDIGQLDRAARFVSHAQVGMAMRDLHLKELPGPAVSRFADK